MSKQHCNTESRNNESNGSNTVPVTALRTVIIRGSFSSTNWICLVVHDASVSNVWMNELSVINMAVTYNVKISGIFHWY